jgi:putative ABC transport system permease protein
MVGIATLTGFLSGVYPAFVLSSLKPVTALKSLRLQSSTIVRKGLMMVQIGVCVTVFLFSLVMLDEIKALKVKDVGFNTQNLIFFEVDDKDLAKRYPAFKKEILRIPGVSNMTASSFVPWQYGFIPSHAYSYKDAAVRAKTFSIDPSFMETYQVPLADGEGFFTDRENTDRVNMEGYIIINETARKLLKSKGTDPLLQNICIPTGWCNRVCGIMQDFYCFYPTKGIEPLAILSSKLFPVARNYMTIRLTKGNHSTILAKIRKTVKRFFSKSLFEVKYVAIEMEKMHTQKVGYRLIALVFITGFALFIAGVDLFGFATYEAERCTKEIGIRKALGAKPMQIAMQFILRFTKLALIANVIAWPICYFTIQRILRVIDYPHPIQISFTYFLWAGLLTLVLTIVSVWVQTFRAAKVDPIKALRYE